LSRVCRSKSSKQIKGKRFFHATCSDGGKDTAVTEPDSYTASKSNCTNSKRGNPQGGGETANTVKLLMGGYSGEASVFMAPHFTLNIHDRLLLETWLIQYI